MIGCVGIQAVTSLSFTIFNTTCCEKTGCVGIQAVPNFNFTVSFTSK